MEIHHITEHQNGGQTTLENGVPVHPECHPKGQKAIDFEKEWSMKKKLITEGSGQN
ncbi:MAG: HNH endonuclease [Bacteroidia bacterium]|nr:HNH endonuclease [Bacteroidia bacterium]